MSRRNLCQTLKAVQLALDNLDSSLQSAGFSSERATYEKMANIVIGQRLWAEAEGVDEFDEQFQRVAGAARRVHDRLFPYIGVMRKLACLEGLVPEATTEVDPNSIAGRILSTLSESSRSMSTSAIRLKVGDSTASVREALRSLTEQGLVSGSSDSSRPLYTLPGEGSQYQISD